MYIKTFGKNDQVCFDSEKDYYEFLGYLAKNDGTTTLVWEKNDEQGAWASEGRIHFYEPPPAGLSAKLKHTAGTGSITSRVNCNDFVEHIARHHRFISNCSQDMTAIRATIAATHIADFARGFNI